MKKIPLLGLIVFNFVALIFGAHLLTEIYFLIFKNTLMYSLRNKVQLIGNLGKNPDIKKTEAGKKLVRFSVATNEVYTNQKGEKVKETQWHNVIAWGKVADIAEKYLNKGMEVAVEGKLITKDYIDKEGNKKYATEVQVNELLMLGNKATA
jgi:single-strand DNA-binding protein